MISKLKAAQNVKNVDQKTIYCEGSTTVNDNNNVFLSKTQNLNEQHMKFIHFANVSVHIGKTQLRTSSISYL